MLNVQRTIAGATVQLRFDDGTILDLEFAPEAREKATVDLSIEAEIREKPTTDSWPEYETTGRRTAHLALDGPVVKAGRSHQPAATAGGAGNARPLDELSSSGLLWLINRTVFHPRGFALALVKRNGEVVGWNLMGDGSEVWRFKDDEDAKFEAAQATLRVAPPALTADVRIDVSRRTT